MSRLIDRILLQGADFRYASDQPIATAYRSLLQQATPILIDNVAEYYFKNRGLNDWKPEDFPNIAPPFEVTWMEFTGIGEDEVHPSTRRHLDEKRQGTVVPRAVGVLSFARSYAPEEEVFNVGTANNARPENFAPGEVAWHVCCTVFYEYPPWAETLSERPLAIGNLHLYVTPEGELHPKCVRTVKSECFWRTQEPGEMANLDTFMRNRKSEQSAKKIMGDFLRIALYPALLATTFMHCRNTALQTDTSVPPKLARAYLRRRKLPMVQFKVLNIGMTRRELKEAGAESEGSGLKRALHQRRGFFRHYGDKWGRGKLFGKYEGMFWTPERDRGDESEGTVVKTYNVKVPK